MTLLLEWALDDDRRLDDSTGAGGLVVDEEGRESDDERWTGAGSDAIGWRAGE